LSAGDGPIQESRSLSRCIAPAEAFGPAAAPGKPLWRALDEPTRYAPQSFFARRENMPANPDSRAAPASRDFRESPPFRVASE